MRKIYGVIPILVLLVSGFVLVRSFNRPTTQNSDTAVAITELSENQMQFEYGDDEITTSWIVLNSTDNLRLINNLNDKLISSQIIDNYDCRELVSAGFYTEDNRPVGYLKIDEGTIRAHTTNSLFNSVLSINYFEVPRITREVPQDQLRIGLQTGPLLIENNQTLPVSSSEAAARRIVAGVTGDNKLVLIALYNSESSLFGPKLSDLPVVLTLWEDKTGIDLADATNLDGGTASAFITEGFKLVESSKVGEFFCNN